MNPINLSEIINSKNPNFLRKTPAFLRHLILAFLSRVLHLHQIERFLSAHADLKGLEFIEAVFEELDVGYTVSDKDRLRIPREGKLVCVANHPLGALDALAVLKAVGDVRRDVKIVANDVLLSIEQLHELLLPFDIFRSRPQKERLKDIGDALMQDEAVIFFPAAEVSRLTWSGIRDKKWMRGPIHFAQKYGAPVLPIYVHGRNSLLFYIISLIYKPFSTFLLAREIFAKRGKTIALTIGDPIPESAFRHSLISIGRQTRLLRSHVYRLPKKKPIFRTEQTVIPPVDPKLLKKELSQSQILGTSGEQKKLFCIVQKEAPHVITEIGRLRELTFRKVGEGTGKKIDVDEFDRFYHHIVLWDEEREQIIGSYRLGLCRQVLAEQGLQGLYIASLFHLSPSFQKLLPNAVELGRSFIRQEYWRSNALDSLWQGIGAFLTRQPDIRYLYGAVSISNAYSDEAKNLIVHYYRKWYPGPTDWAASPHPFRLSKNAEAEAEALLNGKDRESDMLILKTALKAYGFTVPVLFRRYAELCEPEGVKFLEFGSDPAFNDCVDGLILLDLSYLKPKVKERYLSAYNQPS